MIFLSIRGSIRNACVCVCLLGTRHVGLFASLWNVALQAPLSMEFSRQEYWSGFRGSPSSGDLPNPATEPGSPALQADSLPSEPTRKSPLCIRRPLSKNLTFHWAFPVSVLYSFDNFSYILSLNIGKSDCSQFIFNFQNYFEK